MMGSFALRKMITYQHNSGNRYFLPHMSGLKEVNFRPVVTGLHL